MSGQEEFEIERLITRLTEEFPQLSPAVVHATVREIHAGMSGPIRDYIPILVERGSRDRLAARRSIPAGDGSAGLFGVPPLGATVSASGVSFCVYSRDATSITLALFDDVDDGVPCRSFRLDDPLHRTYHYWHVFVAGLRAGQLYGYYADGPHRPEVGLMFDSSKLLIDPYALGVVVPAGYSRAAAAAPGDNTATATKCVVVDPDAYNWEGDRPLGRSFDAGFIYELHVRGFTAHPNSGLPAERRGTFAGLVDKIPYLQALGVTTIELMPVQQFDVQDVPAGPSNYWGYQPVAMFAPHSPYSSRRDRLGAVEEFKDLVKALHRAGIEVILDVVFNHTAEGGPDGPLLSLRGLDNLTYYLVSRDSGAPYHDFTGTGNTVNANETIVRRLILDCLRYWVEHMHVDGFRFDLASVLSRGKDGVPLRDPPILLDIESDPVLAGTQIIAEAWDADGLNQVATFVGDRWAVWNGAYRDHVRRFVKGDAGQASAFADCLTGSAQLFGQPGRDPLRSINFVTAHDGFTLNDLVTYNTKHNMANGEGDRDGTHFNDSWNCGVEGPSGDPEVEALRRRQIRNFLVALLVSQGRPMLLMGDEVRRTQDGNNNAYCQDNETSWYDWDVTVREADLLCFVRKALLYRKGSVLFADRNFWGQTGSAAVTWHGRELHRPDFGADSHALAVELTHPRSIEHLHIVFNAAWEALDFALPPLPDGHRWHRLIDTAQPSPHDFADTPGPLGQHQDRYQVAPRSAVVLIAKPETEQREIEAVIARLTTAFPQLPPSMVATTISDVHAQMTGPVQDFIPILVERRSRDLLRAAALEHVPR
jgi:glycogen operon protein